MLLPVIDKEGSVTNVVLSYDIFQQTWTELSLDCDYIYSDIGRGKVYGSYLVGSRYTVLELLELVSGVLGDNDPTPEFVTKSVEFGRSKDGSRVKWLRRFRVDAEGSWTVYFYVDNVLRYTKALSGIDGSDRYVWYDFDEEIKGFNVYAKVVATGSSDHGNRVFKSLEVD
jgi:hypothetical protein